MQPQYQEIELLGVLILIRSSRRKPCNATQQLANGLCGQLRPCTGISEPFDKLTLRLNDEIVHIHRRNLPAQQLRRLCPQWRAALPGAVQFGNQLHPAPEQLLSKALAQRPFVCLWIHAEVFEVLAIVEYLSFDAKSADLLYEVINQRYEQKSLILTTNKPFKEWNEVFPNAACIATMLDRLLHHAEVTVIEGSSYRVRESEQEATARRRRKK